MLLMLTAVASPAAAQRHRNADRDRRTTYALEVFAGGVDFGPFLKLAEASQVLPTTGPEPDSEVRLLAARSYAVGGAVTVQPWPKAAIRLGATWVPTEFEFQDDSGLGTGAGDFENRGDLNAFLFDLSVLYSVLDPDATAAPYAIAGISTALWSAGDDAGPGGTGLLPTEDQGTQWRFGGLGGAGVRVAASERVGFRVEFVTFAVGNPFDGDDAFVLADTGREKIDEPSITRVSRLTAGVEVRLGGDGRRSGRRRRR